MISAYTGTRIRETERRLLEASADPGMGAVLMQRAAHGLANTVILELRRRGLRPYGSRATVLAGKGNNGGDGLYAAALLARRGLRTTAVLTAGQAHAEALAAFRAAGGEDTVLTEANAGELAGAAARDEAIIDAVLGTGAQGGLRGPAARLFDELQRDRDLQRAGTRGGRGFVVACDIPSGVDANTGEAHGPVLAADLTVTFGAAKAGLLADPGADYTGRLRIIPIGIEDALERPDLRRLEAADLAVLLPHPGRRSHKYSRGVLGVVAGSARYPGAAVLACKGALAAGAGMVRYVGPPEVADLVRQSCPEVVCGSSVADAHVQAWLLGPGLDDGAHEQLERVREAAGAGLPTVADAGALPALPRALSASTILTPHAGELAKLLERYGAAPGRSAVEDSTLAAARQASALTGASVLLKGATTLVAAPSGSVFSQAEASPWMASAGSGDVLAGILGALLAQLAGDRHAFGRRGIDEPDHWAAIAALAASLHGRAGTLASGGGPLTASDIAARLPEVIAEP
ncbi:NAD(P)H-hydrate epimerase [Arthrobacter sp. Hor0625]|uniref:NAD(P)H-hydrate epimerase n=1 Tax=Arthrobacter sp. Hor0625 TaxID=3457358 RepID=UPI00403E624A